VLAETVDLAPGAATIGTISFLIGEQSLVVGGSDGAGDVYFRLQVPGADTADGFKLVQAHTLEPHGAGQRPSRPPLAAQIL
jgi:phosphate transport system permease protein